MVCVYVCKRMRRNSSGKRVYDVTNSGWMTCKSVCVCVICFGGEGVGGGGVVGGERRYRARMLVFGERVYARV